jgi:DNA-binding NarL/FixJ family response regulator
MGAETLRAAPSGTARLVIADDHELARAGIRSMLASERDLELVGEDSNGHQAVAVCQRLRPDLVLMDMRMRSATS